MPAETAFIGVGEGVAGPKRGRNRKSPEMCNYTGTPRGVCDLQTGGVEFLPRLAQWRRNESPPGA